SGCVMKNAAAEEIGIGGLRQLLLDDFHKLLAKPLASHIFHRPDDHEPNNHKPDRSFATKPGHFYLLRTGVSCPRAFLCEGFSAFELGTCDGVGSRSKL